MNVPMFWHVEINLKKKTHFWTHIPEISNEGNDYRGDRCSWRHPLVPKCSRLPPALYGTINSSATILLLAQMYRQKTDAEPTQVVFKAPIRTSGGGGVPASAL